MDHHEADTALVRRIVDEIWNAGDLDLADELFASTYVNHGGLIPDLVRGPEGIKVSVAMYRAAFPDLHVSVDGLSSRDGRVHLRWTARIASAGSEGAAGGGHRLTGETTSSVNHSQVVESWTSWDSTVALETLGMFAERAGG